MRSTTKLAALVAAVGLLLGTRAEAATATGTFAVTASVNPTCTISGSALNFGNYDPNSGTPLDGQTSLSLTCTKNTGYSVALSSGNGSGTSFTMKEAGGTSLDYVLYSNTDRAAGHVWNASAPVTGVAGSRSAITLQVYGRIPINQDVTTGAVTGNLSANLAYSDTVTATVTF